MTTHPEPHDEPLAPVVRQMLAATNAEDRESFIDAFAADAVVDDFGRRFVGHEQIGRWSDAENIGTHNRIEVTGIRATDEGVLLDISVTGMGYTAPAPSPSSSWGTRSPAWSSGGESTSARVGRRRPGQWVKLEGQVTGRINVTR